MYYNNYTYTNYSQYNNDTNLIFVNGLEDDRGYRIRQQQTVLLVDSTQSRIYLKSTDNLGIEKMKTYSIAEVENKKEKDVETRLDNIETNINKIMETIANNKGIEYSSGSSDIVSVLFSTIVKVGASCRVISNAKAIMVEISETNGYMYNANLMIKRV